MNINVNNSNVSNLKINYSNLTNRKTLYQYPNNGNNLSQTNFNNNSNNVLLKNNYYYHSNNNNNDSNIEIKSSRYSSRINKEKHIIKASISMFGRETPVELDFTDVEKLK
jgi:hypothetical protein